MEVDILDGAGLALEPRGGEVVDVRDLLIEQIEADDEEPPAGAQLVVAGAIGTPVAMICYASLSRPELTRVWLGGRATRSYRLL